MTPDLTAMDRLLLSTLALLRESSSELADDEEAAAEQVRELTRLESLLEDSDPVAGSVRVQLRPRARVALLTGLADCVARAERYTALPALRERHATLLRVRDAWITKHLRRR